jgi:hypothetical protein
MFRWASFSFYQQFWDVVKNNLMVMFLDFHEGKLDLFRLNFAILTLISKEVDSSNMKKIRPISLLNYELRFSIKCLLVDWLSL